MINYMKRCYQKKTSTISRTVADEVILVPIQSNTASLEKVYIIKGTGRRIWELIDGRKSVEKIRRQIVREFKVTPQEAEEDLVSFLRELEKKSHIEVI